MPTIPTAVRRLAATHHILRAPRGPQGDLLDPEGIQAEVEAILAYEGEEDLQEAVSHASLPVTQDGQVFGGRRPLQEAEGETPDLDDAEALAAFYAEILNALEVTGDDVEDLAEQADEELNGSGWNVARKPSGSWAPVRDVTELTEAFLLEGGERSPKGGVSLGGKFYPGGRFIPKEAIKNASPEDRIRLEQAQQIAAGKAAEKQQARTARGGVDVGDLSGRLQRYARSQPLTPSEKTSAGRAARALFAHHGDLTAHRIEELAQRVDAALKATDRPGVAKYMAKQLAKLHHALQYANERGVSGDTPGSTPQSHPPTPARADAHGVAFSDLKNIHKYAGQAGLPLTYADEKAILGDARGRAQREKVGLGASHINAAFEVWRRKKKEEQAAAPAAPTPAAPESAPAPQEPTPAEASAQHEAEQGTGDSKQRTGRDGMVYTRAPIGGAVSPVNGQHYRGGTWMPIHGLSAGQEKAPKGDGTGGPPPKANEDGKGKDRSPPREISQEEAERRREDAIRQSRVKAILDSPLERLVGVNKHTGKPFRDVPGWRDWKDWAEEVGEDRLKQIADTLRPTSGDALLDYQDELEHPQGFAASTTKKHKQGFPSSVEAYAALSASLRHSQGIDDVERIAAVLSGSPSPDTPGFTGTDAQGREWVNGELVAKVAPEPAPAPVAPTPAPLSTGDVAKHARVAPRTVSKWVDSGRLPGTRDPQTGNRTVAPADFVAFLNDHGFPIPPELADVKPTPQDEFLQKVKGGTGGASGTGDDQPEAGGAVREPVSVDGGPMGTPGRGSHPGDDSGISGGGSEGTGSPEGRPASPTESRIHDLIASVKGAHHTLSGLHQSLPAWTKREDVQAALDSLEAAGKIKRHKGNYVAADWQPDAAEVEDDIQAHVDREFARIPKAKRRGMNIEAWEQQTADAYREKTGFTGTDPQGREWRDGELVPAGESEASSLDQTSGAGTLPSSSQSATTTGGKTMPATATKMGPEKARKTIEDALKTAPQDRPGRIYIPDLRDALNMDPEEFDRALKDMRREEAIRLVAVGDRSRHTSDALRRGMIQGENEAFGYIELPDEEVAPPPAVSAGPKASPRAIAELRNAGAIPAGFKAQTLGSMLVLRGEKGHIEASDGQWKAVDRKGNARAFDSLADAVSHLGGPAPGPKQDAPAPALPAAGAPRQITKGAMKRNGTALQVGSATADAVTAGDVVEFQGNQYRVTGLGNEFKADGFKQRYLYVEPASTAPAPTPATPVEKQPAAPVQMPTGPLGFTAVEALARDLGVGENQAFHVAMYLAKDGRTATADEVVARIKDISTPRKPRPTDDLQILTTPDEDFGTGARGRNASPPPAEAAPAPAAAPAGASGGKATAASKGKVLGDLLGSGSQLHKTGQDADGNPIHGHRMSEEEFKQHLATVGDLNEAELGDLHDSFLGETSGWLADMQKKNFAKLSRAKKVSHLKDVFAKLRGDTRRAING